ncbi:MAG: hypothetical protein ABR591_05790 [Candidatus Velthaea sp.]
MHASFAHPFLHKITVDRAQRGDGRALPFSVPARENGTAPRRRVPEFGQVRGFSAGCLFILDDPEAALSATRQLALVARLHDLLNEGPRTQFIVATQSPILQGVPGAHVLSLNDGRITNATYESTAAYLITRRYFEDRHRVLRELIANEPPRASGAPPPLRALGDHGR